MADRWRASIAVGGKLTASQFEKAVSILKDINRAEFCMNGGFLYTEDNEARGGQFEREEEELRKLGIPFERDSDAYYEYKAEKCVHIGDGKMRCDVVDDSGNPIVDYRDLFNLVKALAGKHSEDLPIIATTEKGWAKEFAVKGLTGATDLATYLKEKLESMSFSSLPELAVEGMTYRKVAKYVDGARQGKH